MRYPYVLFDFDGTLVDPLDDLTGAANAAREAVGLEPLPRETVRGFVGDGLVAFLQRSLPAEYIERAQPVFKAYYREHLTDHTRVYAGVPETLARLQDAGCRMAVVTNKPVVFTRQIMDELKVKPFISVVLGVDSLPQRKPEPEPFLKALELLGGKEKSEALVVGDGHQDIKAARAAQLPVCGVLYGMGLPERVRQLAPDYMIERMEDLPRIVL
jgi:phosphoglycolate phosphatase